MKDKRPYEEIEKCIYINILNFKMFDCLEYHSTFSVREAEDHKLMTDKMKMYFLELPKVEKINCKNKSDTGDSLRLWMQLFKATSKAELDMLKGTQIDAMQSAVKAIYNLSEDEKIRESVRQREKAKNITE